LEQALASNPHVALQTIARTAPPAAGDYDVVVCDECPSLPSEAGGVLWVRSLATSDQQSASARGADRRATARSAPLVVAETGHPIARALDLDEASAVIAGDAAIPAGAAVIVRAAAQPAVVAYDEGGRRVVDLRVALRDSTLPLSVGFPILVANAAE